MNFIEIEDGVWIPTASITSVTETSYGCEVQTIDGGIYRLGVGAGDFILRIRGSKVGGCFS